MPTERLNQILRSLENDPSVKTKNPVEIHSGLMNHMRRNPTAFHLFHQLTVDQFNFLADLINPHLYGHQMPTDFCLSLALRFITNDPDIEFSYDLIGLDFSDLPGIIDNVYNAIIVVLKHRVFSLLTDEEEQNIVKQFDEMWNFPNCIGAVEFRRILCQPRSDEGNTNFGAVLRVVSDAYCRFNSVCIIITPANVEKYKYNEIVNCASKANGVMSRFRSEMNDNGEYVTVGSLDSDFTTTNMQPYDPVINDKQRIFNNRLEKAKSVVDMALTILLHHWEIFSAPLPVEPERLQMIVECTVLLHNWLITEDLHPGVQTTYLPEKLFDVNYKDKKLLSESLVRYSTTPGVQPLQNDTGTLPAPLNITFPAEAKRNKLAGQFRSEAGAS